VRRRCPGHGPRAVAGAVCWCPSLWQGCLLVHLRVCLCGCRGAAHADACSGSAPGGLTCSRSIPSPVPANLACSPSARRPPPRLPLGRPPRPNHRSPPCFLSVLQGDAGRAAEGAGVVP
jgi:hypothetical protein